MISKIVKLEEFDYYKLHLDIINNFLPVKMSDTERKVIAAFLTIPELIRFEPKGKKEVRERLNMSHASLSNHIVSLRKKKFILEDENGEYIIPIVIPNGNQQEYRFKLIKNGNQ